MRRRAARGGAYPPMRTHPGWVGYTVTILAEIALTAGLILLHQRVTPVSLPLPYVLLTLAVAYFYGKGPAILAFVLGFFSYDYYLLFANGFNWPPAMTPNRIVALSAFFVGSAAVAYMALLFRDSVEQTGRLAQDYDAEQRRLRAVLDALPVGVFIADVGGRIHTINHMTAQIWGGAVLSRDVPGYGQYKGWWADTGEPIAAGNWALARAVTKGEVSVGEVIDIQRFDGGRATILNSAAPIRDQEGNIMGAVVTVQDITAQRETERHAREQASTLQTILDTAPIGIIVAEANEFKTIYYSREALEICGGSVPSIYQEPGAGACHLMHTDGTPFGPEDLPLARSLRLGERVREMEVLLKRADGQEAIVMVESAPVRDAEGRITSAVSIIEDITEAIRSRRELEGALERELGFSRLLQRALLPGQPAIDPRYSVATSYLPAYATREIGGDFYDVFRTADGRDAIVIGDVSGKGLESASVAAQTRSTVRAFGYDTSSAAKALTLANAALSAQTAETDLFVTVFLAILDPDTGNITYASAGHTPTAMCRVGGGVDFLSSGEPPLGLLSDYPYTEFSTHLEPGEKTVLYTDGISEARRANDLFDTDGIARTLSGCVYQPADVAARILLAAASEWAYGQLTDDAAIVVVERLREPPHLGLAD